MPSLKYPRLGWFAAPAHTLAVVAVGAALGGCAGAALPSMASREGAPCPTNRDVRERGIEIVDLIGPTRIQRTRRVRSLNSDAVLISETYGQGSTYAKMRRGLLLLAQRSDAPDGSLSYNHTYKNGLDSVPEISAGKTFDVAVTIDELKTRDRWIRELKFKVAGVESHELAGCRYEIFKIEKLWRNLRRPNGLPSDDVFKEYLYYAPELELIVTERSFLFNELPFDPRAVRSLTILPASTGDWFKHQLFSIHNFQTSRAPAGE